jgi:YkoY family integral membrane protein
MLDQFLDASPSFGVDTLFLLLILVSLEAVLSADNAIALAALAQGLEDRTLENKALNFGLVLALVLRMGLILAATWVTKFWQFQLLGGGYLLWLAYQYFSSATDSETHHHRGPKFSSLWQAVPLIAVTDLAFSLDSVTTAIAVSQETWLVLTGGFMGVLTLRFMAGLFIRWLEEYTYLQDAGYYTVVLVGLRLLFKVVNLDWLVPEWLMISAIALLFTWGFSRRVDPSPPTHPEVTEVASTPERTEATASDPLKLG